MRIMWQEFLDYDCGVRNAQYYLPISSPTCIRRKQAWKCAGTVRYLDGCEPDGRQGAFGCYVRLFLSGSFCYFFGVVYHFFFVLLLFDSRQSIHFSFNHII
jgi:hypothetical protein